MLYDLAKWLLIHLTGEPASITDHTKCQVRHHREIVVDVCMTVWLTYNKFLGHPRLTVTIKHVEHGPAHDAGQAGACSRAERD
jgi:hypothetical protein